MEKIVRTLFLALVVLAATGVANADWTTNVYSESVVSDVALGNSYQWGSNDVGNHYTVQWDHTWAIPSGGDIVSANLTAAQLSIESQYTSDKTESIRVNSLANPSVADLVNGWIVPVDVLPYVGALDESATVYATLFDNVGDYGTVILNNSKLDLTYEVTERVWVEPEPQPIPAPAAIILGSLGAGLVGWLRRRSMV